MRPLRVVTSLNSFIHTQQRQSFGFLIVFFNVILSTQVGVSGRGKAAQMRRQYRVINGARSLSKVPPELAPERPEMLGPRGGPAPREWVLVARDELAELQVRIYSEYPKPTRRIRSVRMPGELY